MNFVLKECFRVSLYSVIISRVTISTWALLTVNSYQRTWGQVVRRWPQKVQQSKWVKCKRKRHFNQYTWTHWLPLWATGTQSTRHQTETLWNIPQSWFLEDGEGSPWALLPPWPLSSPSRLVAWEGVRGSPWPEKTHSKLEVESCQHARTTDCSFRETRGGQVCGQSANGARTGAFQHNEAWQPFDTMLSENTMPAVSALGIPFPSVLSSPPH